MDMRSLPLFAVGALMLFVNIGWSVRFNGVGLVGVVLMIISLLIAWYNVDRRVQ